MRGLSFVDALLERGHKAFPHVPGLYFGIKTKTVPLYVVWGHTAGNNRKDEGKAKLSSTIPLHVQAAKCLQHMPVRRACPPGPRSLPMLLFCAPVTICTTN